MPEGDTVWLVSRRLDEALSGEVLTRSDFRVPQLANADLVGRRVLTTSPRGKHILTRVEGGLTLHSHLRMDGSWHLYRPDVRWTGGPEHMVRLVLSTAGWDAVGYRLHDLALVASDDEDRVVGHLGPDLLDPDGFDAEEALHRLGAQPDREVGQALLDQRNLAGIGNLYKAESLFVGRVSPWMPVAQVPDLAGVVETARRLLDRNKDHWSQSTTGEVGRDRQHYVFERAGRPCRRCGGRVESAMQGEAPYDRITYWCPVCQPGPHPEPMRQGRPRGGSGAYDRRVRRSGRG
ncbi:MAG: DNA-formamidopyrimidine glycosylase family protein [Candidatus Nanopelagicales bacterium]